MGDTGKGDTGEFSGAVNTQQRGILQFHGYKVFWALHIVGIKPIFGRQVIVMP